MARWLIKLAGERADVEDFPKLFPNGDTFAVGEDGGVCLTGTEFERLSDAGEVRDRAAEVIDEMFPLVSLHFGPARKPGIEVVIREGDDGVRTRHMLLSTFGARGKVSVFGVSSGSSGLTQAQQGLAAIRASPHLRAAALRWSAPYRTWTQLFTIYEEIRAHLKRKEPDAAGLCTEDSRKRFTRSAQSALVAGVYARHGPSKAQPVKNPMTLTEATEFILDLLRQVLR